MIDLNSIIQSAQGGQAIDNLSARFGLTPAQTQSAVNALLPAVRMGLQNRIEGGGLGSILGHLNNPVHQEAYNDPAATQAPGAAALGGSILGDLFGGAQTTAQVSQQAATQSGVPASIIQAMLPVIASIIMGGLMHGGPGGGLGGILSGVLGSVMGDQGQAQSGPGPGQGGGIGGAGGLGGVIGSVLGGLLGGGGAESTAPAQQERMPEASVPQAPSSASATLSEISDMFRSGAPSSPDHEAQLASILGR